MAACGKGEARVVVYTALDSIYSEPILTEFTRQSGIAVDPVYDAEASKTTGLVARLMAERERPRCDVFWNNEIVQTIRLERAGALAAYVSPSAAAIDPQYKDPQGYWTGFAARTRVLAWNKTLVADDQVPSGIEALAGPQWRGKVAIAYPLFGTTATHAALLEAMWTPPRAREWFAAMHANGAVVMDGNGAVCRAVAQGEIALGITDSDDANLMSKDYPALGWKPLDHGGEGGVLIPNTVALVAGAPNPDAARKLIDHLLSPEVEAKLAASPSAQIPLHPGVEVPEIVKALAAHRYRAVDYAAAAELLPESADSLKKLFAQP